MGKALEVVTGRALNPGAGPTALVANTGNTFSIRSTDSDPGAELWGLWGQAATAGLVRLRSPRLHDNVQGLRYVLPAATVRNFLPDEATSPLYSQDTLVFEIGGGAAETDSAAFLVYYDDLGGSDARFATWDQLAPNVVEVTTIEVGVAGPVTAGDWSPGTALNATFDLLKANQDYAVLGYIAGTACNAVAISGPDTGNYRAGGPGPVEAVETRDWFVSLSKAHGKPCIPVINQANRANTLASVALNTAAGTVTVDFVVARLASRFTG